MYMRLWPQVARVWLLQIEADNPVTLSSLRCPSHHTILMRTLLLFISSLYNGHGMVIQGSIMARAE